MATEQHVPDLAQLREVDAATAARALTAAEMAAGLRCNACGQRIEEGVHYFLLSPHHQESRVVVQTRRVAVCDRDGCAWYGLDTLGDATYVTPVSFTWLSPDPAAA